MKILHYGLSDRVGGIERSLLKVATHIDRSAFSFHFLYSEGTTPSFLKELKALGCGFIALTPRRVSVRRNQADLERILGGGEFDLLHCHLNTLSYVAPALVALDLGVPVLILHVIKALGRGGAEVLLVEGLRVADRDRFELSYLSLQSQPDDVAADLMALGARVETLHLDRGLTMLLGARRLARYLEAEGIDLVHAHLPLAGVVARIAGRLAKVPVVYTEHSPLHRYHPVSRRLSLLTWRWQDQVIAISDDVSASVLKHAGGVCRFGRSGMV
jgi:glycosyltransferase involved in cell wall biosynthesis